MNIDAEAIINKYSERIAELTHKLIMTEAMLEKALSELEEKGSDGEEPAETQNA
ncbi:hypothetical protein [Arcanobacterium buesumense]|uniref:Uncharacterized protein n=1 Tax=Arcanobacterium buesumense TaxID=2722751 RepID=A0A6H2ELQ6_9ACTO|nr:hypothetical protein [Arcanobacterium buesumense]QJC22001.1 hypothetical protein HC352_05460 [Arcanobacterium buesumense]